MARNTVTVTSAHALTGTLDALRAEPARSAILLDVDGTLAPIVRHADDAHVPEPTRAPLIAIARRYGFVACVSGRRAATARRIVSLGTITYVGNHGAEVLRGGATDVEVDPEFAAWRERVRAFADAAMADETLTRLRVRAEGEGFLTHWGRKVLEIRPAVAMDKGRGIERVLEGVDLDVALYAGDDRTDLDAFAALRRLVDAGRLQRAVCVGVASDETPPELIEAADVMVDGPRGVRELLSALAG